MGRLAEAAGTKALTGAVAMTDARGCTITYADEAAAEAALPAGCEIEHKRGAFFLKGATPVPKPASGRRRRRTADES